MKNRISGLKFHPQDNSAVLRTGAAHPLLDFSGCGCTRRTRSNGAPVIAGPNLKIELRKRTLFFIEIVILSLFVDQMRTSSLKQFA